ncbi:MAG: hypothetical protein SFU27_13675 [Thermonemataceae bacterium]|nr:hypothetical protein [Thermonemataceae bacterium]
MIEMKMTEGMAYVFFIALFTAAFAIGAWLQKNEKKRNPKM